MLMRFHERTWTQDSKRREYVNEKSEKNIRGDISKLRAMETTDGLDLFIFL